MKRVLSSGQPLRIGIWCKYHITLAPSEGIGVFAHNLARGLASLPSQPHITLCIQPGDAHVVAETERHGEGRISLDWPRPRSAEEMPGRWGRAVEFLQLELRRASQRDRGYFRRKLARLGLRMPEEGSTGIAARMRRAAVKATAAGLQMGNRLFCRLLACTVGSGSSRGSSEPGPAIFLTHEERELHRIIESCDVWIVPYVGLDVKFSKPTVVVIHDLVFYHFPETIPPAALPIIKELVTRVAAQSTLAACMSEFICTNDLRGVLGLPAWKTKVVQPAAPRDFPTACDRETAVARYPVLARPYIFYPAAFRAYKNHQLLIEALKLSSDPQLQLVFTGIHDPPAELLELIRRHGLEERVHILGKVDRDVLASCYQHALLTIVPSFYEQGSFPIMEAIHWGCPVACSNIPSLVELFAPLGEAMLFFDPRDPQAVADIFARVSGERETIRQNQQAASRQMFARTWRDAAADWLPVLEEAIARHPRTDSEAATSVSLPKAA